MFWISSSLKIANDCDQSMWYRSVAALWEHALTLPRDTCTHSPCHTSTLQGDRQTVRSHSQRADDADDEGEGAVKVSFSK